MAQMMLLNPRKKRTKRRTKRRTVSVTARVNPRPRRRKAAAAAPVARRRRRGLRSRVSRARRAVNRPGGFIRGTLAPSMTGAAGALGVDILLGFLPLPAAVQTGALRPIVRIGAALALGMVAGKVAGKRTGEMVTAGAVTVVMYDTFKGLARNVMPTLPGLSGYQALEYYNPGVNVGEYVANANTTAMPIGEYVL